MEITRESLIKFLYSPNLYFGCRKAVGLFIPIFIFFGLIHNTDLGIAFASGTSCMAIIDQPGASTLRAHNNALLVGLLLCCFSTLVCNLVAPYALIAWVVASLFVFCYSMLSVYGKQGMLIGFSALLCTFINLNYPHPLPEALLHSALTFAGGAFYFLFSFLISYFFREQQERQLLATALYDTAIYMKARSDLYDVNLDLEESYRDLIKKMARMFESHQLARDMVLRHLPKEGATHDTTSVRHWNIFVHMLSLLDNLVASQTDYQYLREQLGDHDALLFARDTLRTLSRTLDRAGTDLLTHSPLSYRSSVKAELRAFEYELEQFKRKNLQDKNPELYSLLIQVYRRLRNATFAVEQISNNLRSDLSLKPIDYLRRDKSLLQFRTKNNLSFSRLVVAFTPKSATFRYSMRVTLAIVVVHIFTVILPLIPLTPDVQSALTSHINWILVTVLLIMRPGFALTQQRRSLRLLGTALGCLISIGLLLLIQSTAMIIGIMLVSMILGYTFSAKNFKVGSLFLTIYILIGYHLLVPGSYWVIGERVLDTAIACLVTFIFSFVMPKWEKESIPNLARNTIVAVREYLKQARLYADSLQNGSSKQYDNPNRDPLYSRLQLMRKNVHQSYGLFADSLARMMNEPKRQQLDVIKLNRMLIHSDALASQIIAIVPIMTNLDHLTPELNKSFDYVDLMLNFNVETVPTKAPPIESGQAYMAMRFPIKQMYTSVQFIRQEGQALHMIKSASS